MKKVYLTIWTIALIVFCSYMKIHALTYTTEIKQVASGWIDYGDFQNNGWTPQNGGLYTMSVNSLNSDTIQNKSIVFNNLLNVKEYDFISIPFITSMPSVQGQTNGQSDYMCEEWQLYNNNWRCISFTNNGVSQNYPYTNEINNLQFQFQIVYAYDDGTSAGWNTCDIENNSIMCPLTGTKVKAINIYYYWYQTGSVMYTRIGFGGGFRVYKYNSPTGAIENQTQQQQQQYEQATNGTWAPNNNINTQQNGANETIEWGQKEEELLDSLDMNTTMLSDITINPTASAFIWDIVGGLRNMNPAIIMVMTSILGLGIAKMLLNR